MMKRFLEAALKRISHQRVSAGAAHAPRPASLRQPWTQQRQQQRQHNQQHDGAMAEQEQEPQQQQHEEMAEAEAEAEQQLHHQIQQQQEDKEQEEMLEGEEPAAEVAQHLEQPPPTELVEVDDNDDDDDDEGMEVAQQAQQATSTGHKRQLDGDSTDAAAAPDRAAKRHQADPGPPSQPPTPAAPAVPHLTAASAQPLREPRKQQPPAHEEEPVPPPPHFQQPQTLPANAGPDSPLSPRDPRLPQPGRVHSGVQPAVAAGAGLAGNQAAAGTQHALQPNAEPQQHLNQPA